MLLSDNVCLEDINLILVLYKLLLLILVSSSLYSKQPDLVIPLNENLIQLFNVSILLLSLVFQSIEVVLEGNCWRRIADLFAESLH